MKNLLILIILFFSVATFAQTKEQFMDSIIKENVFHSEYIGGAGAKSRVYKWYEQLMKLVSDDELIALSKHKNATLRMYAIQGLIVRRNTDVPSLFNIELENGEMVETLNGCIMDWELTYDVVYSLENEAIAKKAFSISNDLDKFDSIMQKLQREDPVLNKMDSIILTRKRPLSWRIYSRVFDKGKHNAVLMPDIEKLAFQENNSYAYNYLKEYYPDTYKDKMENYLIKVFPKAKFTEGDNFMINGEWVYLRYFLTELLESNNPEYRNIATAKLRQNKWLADIDQWYNDTIEKYNIKP